MELSFTVQCSKDMVYGICMEVVWKPTLAAPWDPLQLQPHHISSVFATVEEC